MVSVGYNRLPDLGMLWLNRQLTLTEAQSAQARADMAELLAWHRRTHLPAMARLASGTTPAQVAELQRNQSKGNDEFREAYSATARRAWFTPAHAATDDSHTPGTLSAQAGLDKRLDSLADRYSQLYGPLNDAQVALLRESVRASGFQPERSLAERERRQAELRQTLVSLQSPVGQTDAERVRWTQTRVQAWLAGFAASPTPGYNSYARQLVQDGCEQFAALHRSTTPDQRNHAVSTLRAYKAELRALARP